MQFIGEKNGSDNICAVCGGVVTAGSPVGNLCKDCFEKEVILSRLIEYLQNADAKTLNIIQSYSLQNVSVNKRPCDNSYREKTVKKAYIVRVSDGIRYELNRPVTKFGRNKEKADCVIQNSAMSGNHASVINENNIFYITDNSSSNGTWLNDKKLSPNVKCRLCNGDKIRFANEQMIFLVE